MKSSTSFLMLLLALLITGTAFAEPAPPKVVLYPVAQKNKWGYMDKTGKVIIPLQFEKADFFSEGLAPVKIDGKVGYINETGAMAISPLFDDGAEFIDGIAAVKVGSRWGYIDRTGKFIWEPSK